eukprot:COSAG01_NODE_857_length_13073_cov_13.630415_14_plen_49_part_01
MYCTAVRVQTCSDLPAGCEQLLLACSWKALAPERLRGDLVVRAPSKLLR